MGKKEASKGREWEKGRRDVLNQAFCDLYKALPSYVEGRTISKKTILIQALASICQLKEGKGVQDVQGTEQLESSAIQKWIHHILSKFSQLVLFLRVSNVEVPADYITLEAPPVCVRPDIVQLVSEIGTSIPGSCNQTQRNSAIQKQKQRVKLKNDRDDTISLMSDIDGCAAPKKVLPTTSVKAVPCSNFKSDFNTGLVTNPTMIQSNPVVVQPSPLQTQLLFTSGSPSAPLTSPLPLLVSVTSVKTVNPFILVQSNVMAPTPLSTQKVVCSANNARPIQPGPPNKALKKAKKVPIPSLKPKTVLRNISSQVTSRKFLKRDSRKIVPKTSGGANKDKSLKSSKGIRLSKLSGVKPSNTVAENKFSSPVVPAKCGDTTSEKQIGTQMGERNQEIILDIDKENVAGNSNSCTLIGNNEKLDTLTSSTSEEMCVTTESDSIKGSSKEATVDVPPANTNVEQQLQIEENATKTFKVPGNITTEKKRLCEVDTNIDNLKRLKCDLEAGDTHGEKPGETLNSVNSTDEISSPSKTSKSNYTISALCARRQLLQNPEAGGGNSTQVTSHERVSDLLNSKPTSMRLTGDVSEGIGGDKSNDNFYNLVKSKGTVSAEMYSEWSDKSKFKSDRACSSYNLFSSVPLHNNKNTFIPITDIDNFKTVPEPFDSTDSSFGLPLHPSDISNDIFASLQVPAGGHHSESISPTAAFLLAFPLVSTSKASELLSDEAACENNDSQPGMKTILQIGNLDCDTPVTKCVSVFSSIDGSSIVDSAPNDFSQDTLSSAILKNKSLHPSVDVGSFMQKHCVENNAHAVKCSNVDHIIPLKESSSFLQRTLQTSVSLKDNTSLSSKAIYQNPCSSNDKLTCQSRSEPTSVPSDDSTGMAPGSELGGTVPIKTSLKLNTSQQSTLFLNCEKQPDWLEITQTSQGTFPDFSTSASRSDCAVNYVLPSTLMSSSTNGEELHSSSRHHSSSILSWSTMNPSDNIQLSKPTSKLSHVQEAYPSSKVLTKTVEMQQLIPNHSGATSTSNQSQMIPGSSLPISNKLNVNAASYQSQNIVTCSDQGLLLSSKQNVSSSNFISSGSNSVGKKTFSSKQVECSSAEAIKVSSNSSGGVLYTHQQVDLRQGTETSSSSIAYPPSEVKQSKVNIPYYDNRASSQSMKSGLNSTSNNQSSKQSVSAPNYNHSAVNPELKQTSAVASYSHVTSLNSKESISNDHLMMNTYHHQSNNLSKQLDNSVSKKNISHFNHHNEAPADHSKQNASGINFNLENSSNMMQFGNNPVNSSPNHQEQFNDKSNSHEEHQVKPHSSQQRQHCARSNNKEPVPNLHRPPVNWMTAPDIRSHQHHTGPSFGNNSNMNSTQGLFYLSEHTKDPENVAAAFDQSTNFHCLDIPHSSQSLYKGNEIHLFGNETLENFHDNSAWSPNKNSGSSMLGNMMIPSTLPTLVGDLALGDNNISRPYLPPYNNDPQSCSKKSVKKSLNTTRRIADKAAKESNSVSGQAQECVASFLSVSQLVDTGSAGKNRANSSTKEANMSYTSFSEHETIVRHPTKQNLFKSGSSNYSTEALLSSSNTQQMSHFNHHRKRRSHGGPPYTNNYVATGMAYQNSSTATLQVQGPQTQFLPDLPRANDYPSTFLPSDAVPTFMLGNPPRPHRNNSYQLQNVSDRSAEDNSNAQKVHHPVSVPEPPSGRHRSGNNNSIGTSSSSTQVAPTSNIVDFGYMNMPSTMLQDDINFTNHPPPPPHPTFLPHHSYPMPSTQDTIYSAPRLTMHPPQNSNIQSPSATTLTNFHLSTIFPEINEKVIC
ncbi:hypothetical protein ONE63_006555 [Megalurothrips usitatus]|uniref:BHLH domain-containing protein n=1 Tax=Megalurothrips usitatus TaxID=439358 RepID=A0AAV7XUD8_9NEOP|nr:hypothetical protein ONE63_006555 [Megalurothrips usitatus]